MRNKIYSMLLLGVMIVAGCSDFTEIEPKGKNTLSRVEDLDLVLNYTYGLSISDVMLLVNDMYPMTNIPSLLTESIKTLNYSYITWDESVDRAKLTEADSKYTRLYGIIGQVANPVLANIDIAEGDQGMAKRLKAEALVLRGWCHYLAVNLYAKAYDPETAGTDPGILYSLETDDMTVPNEKLTVARVYDLILADVDSALNLGSLPNRPNDMRVGLPFAYAVKAKVLMSMRDYDGAFAAAGEALKLNGTIENYNDMLEVDPMFGSGILQFSHPDLACEEEYFASPRLFAMEALTPELWNTFEDGHVFKEYAPTDVRMFGMGMYGNLWYGLDVPVLMSWTLYYNTLGLTSVDMYLVQAECYIREGNTGDAMDILNKIREKRITPEVYAEKEVSSPEEAFVLLKDISRTESVATPKYFINLKRWNTEAAYQETLHRLIEYDIDSRHYAHEFTLEPDSPLWIFPFPQNATLYNPDLTQNYE